MNKTPDIKTCHSCKLDKPISKFRGHKPAKDGLNPSCRECLAKKLLRRKKIAEKIWQSQNDSTSKTCKKCGLTKPITKFHKSINPKDAREGSCLDCRNKQISKSHQKLMDSMSGDEWLLYKRKFRIRHKYGITLEQFDKILAEQDYGCAICGDKFNSAIRSFCVDHDHSCCAGEKSCGTCVRGLLCDRCNWAIGLLKDSISNIDNAKRYLLKWNT